MEERRLIIQVKGTEPVIDYVIGNNKHVKYYDTQFRVAGLAVESIVKRSIEIKKEEARNKVSGIHDNLIHNIIPFIGERGVGKTSALISFANILREYEGETNEYLNFGNDKDIRFTCLNSIDGSLLEQGEDIFKVILAQMYLEFDKVSKEARRRWDAEINHSGDDKKLRNEFQELYKKLIHLNGDEREKALIGLVSPLESLQWLSSSLDLKKDFERIIKLYLSVMSELSSRTRYSESSVCNSAKHFLVVVIDDLDLNINNGYEMLEKLHRYVMLPNVIILLAVDLKQLTRLCEKHFYDMTPLVDSKLNDQSDVISQLAQDYLNKVMPYHFRVHMPNFGSSGTMIDDEDNRKPDNTLPSTKEAIFNLLSAK